MSYVFELVYLLAGIMLSHVLHVACVELELPLNAFYILLVLLMKLIRYDDVVSVVVVVGRAWLVHVVGAYMILESYIP